MKRFFWVKFTHELAKLWGHPPQDWEVACLDENGTWWLTGDDVPMEAKHLEIGKEIVHEQ